MAFTRLVVGKIEPSKGPNTAEHRVEGEFKTILRPIAERMRGANLESVAITPAAIDVRLADGSRLTFEFDSNAVRLAECVVLSRASPTAPPEIQKVSVSFGLTPPWYLVGYANHELPPDYADRVEIVPRAPLEFNTLSGAYTQMNPKTQVAGSITVQAGFTQETMVRETVSIGILSPPNKITLEHGGEKHVFYITEPR